MDWTAYGRNMSGIKRLRLRASMLSSCRAVLPTAIICVATGATSAESNPNGSIENIAGICNREGNVFGLMPHPDRACDSRLGSADGAGIFLSMAETILAGRAKAAA